MGKRQRCQCLECSPDTPPDAVHDMVRSRVAEHGHTLISVESENPYDIGFSYTIGLEGQGRPELIVFSGTPHSRAEVLEAAIAKTRKRQQWERPMLVKTEPNTRLQLRPVAPQWMLTHALWAWDYWDQPSSASPWPVCLPSRRSFGRCSATAWSRTRSLSGPPLRALT